MKQASNRLPATTKRQSKRCTFGLGLLIASFGLSPLAPSALAAQPKIVASTITILVYNYAEISPLVLAGAEREADRILDQAGVKVLWVDCSKRHVGIEQICGSGWGARNLGLRLLNQHIPTKFQDFTFGFAIRPGLASVYYGDTASLAARSQMRREIPLILGCVIVHEVGHLLLNSNQHEASGIMQANWGPKQIRQLLMGALLFTPEQSKLIREESRSRTSLSVDSSTVETSSR
jgi:hypothetical protein